MRCFTVNLMEEWAGSTVHFAGWLVSFLALLAAGVLCWAFAAVTSNIQAINIIRAFFIFAEFLLFRYKCMYIHAFFMIAFLLEFDTF